jgi:hypothetical protein
MASYLFQEAINAEALCRAGAGRMIEAIEAGATAERFEVRPSSVINWMRHWREHRSAVAELRGRSFSWLDKYAELLLGRVAKQADLTLSSYRYQQPTNSRQSQRAPSTRLSHIANRISYTGDERDWPAGPRSGFSNSLKMSTCLQQLLYGPSVGCGLCEWRRVSVTV